MKKLILTLLLLCSTSLFAGGFDTPTEAFNFYYKLAVKAAAYKDKNGHFSKEHINAMAPHMYAANKDYKGAARRVLGAHWTYVAYARDDYSDRYPMTVNMWYLKKKDRNYEQNGEIVFYYSHYAFQKKIRNVRRIECKAKKVGNKIKWFVI